MLVNYLKKAAIIILALIMMAAFMPEIATQAHAATAGTATLVLNTTSGSDTETEISYTDPGNIKASTDITSDGLLTVNVSQDSCIGSYHVLLFSDAACTQAVSAFDDNSWIVSGGSTYYLQVKPDNNEECNSEGTVVVNAYLAVIPKADINLNSSAYQPYLLYSFGTSKVYAKFTPAKTGFYKIGNMCVLCDKNKKAISVSDIGDGYGLIGGRTYYLSLGYPKYKKTGTADVYTGSIGKIRTIKTNAAAASMKSAKKLKTRKLSMKSDGETILHYGFYLGKSKAKWMKVSAAKTKYWYLAAQKNTIKGDYAFYVYNASGKLVCHGASTSNRYVVKKIKKGTYYVKVIKKSSKATGVTQLSILCR